MAGIPTLSERGIYLRELKYVVVAGGGDPGLPRQGRLDAASYRTNLLIWFSVATPNPADPEPGTCLLLNSESVFGFPIGD